MDLDVFESVLGSGLTDVLRQMQWAADESEAAKRRHHASDERLEEAFPLLRATDPLMRTEFVYRAHVRELLDRIAAGQDTRPGTAAEVACICSNSSLVAPLTEAGMGVYARVWAAAFPDQEQPMADDREHLERNHKYEIDQLEVGARRKAAQDWRRPEKPTRKNAPGLSGTPPKNARRNDGVQELH